jgi:nitrogen-specific signal transduction histidine kinase
LFQPFVTTKPEHIGLGLFFARIVMERNAGAIELTAREGRGTVARISFPRPHCDGASESEEC